MSGSYVVFSDALKLPRGAREIEPLRSLKSRLERYRDEASPTRPLNVGVFGPPGSGKSHAVKEIAVAAKLIASGSDLPVYNLSEFGEPADLRRAFRKIAIERSPVVLFDEFDTDLVGVPLGWLRYFLAPMEDGKFFDQGEIFAFSKVAFVFAGGTADRFEDFEREHRSYFSKRKGPDFVSRLDGFLDVEGINADDCSSQRRELVLEYQLGVLAEKSGRRTRKVEKDLRHALLGLGRYRHGARSLRTVLEMFDWNGWDGRSRLDRNGFRGSPQVLKLHVDRGPLDGMRVGLSVGALLKRDMPEFEQIADGLLAHGATIVYCGYALQTSLMKSILEYQKTDLLALLGEGQELPRVQNYRTEWDTVPADAGWLYASTPLSLLGRYDFQAAGLGLRYRPRRREFYRVRRNRNTIDGASYEQRRALVELALFRMRLFSTRRVDALICIRGRGRKNMAGRFPGIAEEAMLALARGRPVYVLGGFGGAARAVGTALQMLETDPIEPPQMFRQPKAAMALPEEIELLFQTVDLVDAPTDPPGLHGFFARRALGTPGWVDNGLSEAENRQLFASRKGASCARLIIRGLARRSQTQPHG